MVIIRFTRLVSLLAVLFVAARAHAQPVQTPDAETTLKLIAQLGATDFRTRAQAGNELVKLGDAILPALRKAGLANVELEVKRRIEEVIGRIETGLLQVEEKNWQDLDGPKRDIKDRVIKIQARMAAQSEDRLVAAIYLVIVTRPPTDEELAAAKKQLAQANLKVLPLLRLARSLVQSKEANAEVIAVSSRVLKVQNEVLGAGIAEKLPRLNSPELNKMIKEVAASLNKAAKTDEQFTDLAFLTVLSRLSDEATEKRVVEHLKRAKTDRASATADIIWALINSTEFIAMPK